MIKYSDEKSKMKNHETEKTIKLNIKLDNITKKDRVITIINKIHFIIFDLRNSRTGIGPIIRVPIGVLFEREFKITHAFSPRLNFVTFVSLQLS